MPDTPPINLTYWRQRLEDPRSQTIDLDDMNDRADLLALIDTAEAALAYWNADGYPEPEGRRLEQSLDRYTKD